MTNIFHNKLIFDKINLQYDSDLLTYAEADFIRFEYISCALVELGITSISAKSTPGSISLILFVEVSVVLLIIGDFYILLLLVVRLITPHRPYLHHIFTIPTFSYILPQHGNLLTYFPGILERYKVVGTDIKVTVWITPETLYIVLLFCTLIL